TRSGGRTVVKEYRKRRRNKGLHYEFKAIEVISAGDNQSLSIRSKGQHKVADNAKSEVNRGKNLSDRVLPYERNIVLLDNGKYINATTVRQILAQRAREIRRYFSVWLDNVYSTAEYETRSVQIMQGPSSIIRDIVRAISVRKKLEPGTIRRRAWPAACHRNSSKVHDLSRSRAAPAAPGTYICAYVLSSTSSFSRVEAGRPSISAPDAGVRGKARPGLVGNLCPVPAGVRDRLRLRHLPTDERQGVPVCSQSPQSGKRKTTAAPLAGDKSSTTTTAGRSGFEAEFE
uniref:Ras-associating domain-containing protein n=1 Tax=Macrostomum lignano TaxID=282301 RepID=A0A1I8JPS0_9PLAT